MKEDVHNGKNHLQINDYTQLTRSCRHDSDLMPIPSGTRRGRRIDVGPTTILRHRVEYVKSVSVQLRFDAIGPTRHNRHREEVGKTSGKHRERKISQISATQLSLLDARSLIL